MLPRGCGSVALGAGRLLFGCERFSPGNYSEQMSRAVTIVKDKMTHRLG